MSTSSNPILETESDYQRLEVITGEVATRSRLTALSTMNYEAGGRTPEKWPTELNGKPTAQIRESKRKYKREIQRKAPTVRESGLATTGHEEISEPENQHEVGALAYELWQARGCPDGTSEEDWFRAEQKIAT
jgi:hypothetical protein